MNGMSKEMYDFLLSIKDSVNYNLELGIIITPNGKNGTICSSTGYLRFRKHGRLLQVHQFLSVIYFGELCIGKQVNHIDGNKTNNKKENLEIVSQQENLKHQWDNKMRKIPDQKGSNHSQAILNEVKVLEIRNMYQKGIKISKIAREYNVSHGCISQIVKRKTWKHI